MSAGTATLEILKKNGSEIYSKIGLLGREADGRVVVTGKDSMFMPHFTQKSGIHKVKNASDAAKCDTAALYRYHFSLIARSGIFFLPGKLGAISDAHTKSDVSALIAATEKYAQNTA